MALTALKTYACCFPLCPCACAPGADPPAPGCDLDSGGSRARSHSCALGCSSGIVHHHLRRKRRSEAGARAEPHPHQQYLSLLTLSRGRGICDAPKKTCSDNPLLLIDPKLNPAPISSPSKVTFSDCLLHSPYTQTPTRRGFLLAFEG